MVVSKVSKVCYQCILCHWWCMMLSYLCQGQDMTMSALTALSLCPPVTGIFLPNPCHSQTDTNNKTGNFLVSEKFRKHSTTDEIFPLCSEIK